MTGAETCLKPSAEIADIAIECFAAEQSQLAHLTRDADIDRGALRAQLTRTARAERAYKDAFA